MADTYSDWEMFNFLPFDISGGGVIGVSLKRIFTNYFTLSREITCSS